MKYQRANVIWPLTTQSEPGSFADGLEILRCAQNDIMECLEKDPARRPTSAEAVSTRLDAVSLESAWTVEPAERWWAMHRPLPADARRVAEVLLSQEGRELRIGPRVRPRG